MDKIILYDLETDLHELCNLKCAQCTHSSPFFSKKDEIYNFDQFCKDIDALAKVATIKVFRIVGGEPLLNKNLIPFLKKIKESKICEHLTLFTNGLVLGHINNEALSIIDRLRISVYSNLPEAKLKLIGSNIEWARQNYPNLNIVANNISHFSKFNLIEENKNEELVKEIYNRCYYSYEHRGFSIFNGRFYKCFASRKKYNFIQAHKHLDPQNYEHLEKNIHDSIELSTDLTPEQLNSFIMDKTPLEGCKWCLGTCGKQINHSQLKPGENDTASIEDLSFEDGEIYMSNLLFSWDQGAPVSNLPGNTFFKKEYLKYYFKHFKIPHHVKQFLFQGSK